MSKDQYDLLYDGTHLIWETQCGISYKATSGFIDQFKVSTDFRKPDKQGLPDLGPIPEGKYRMPLALGGDTQLLAASPDLVFEKKDAIQNLPTNVHFGHGAQKQFFSHFFAWGCHRVPLERQGDNPTGRKDFYIHDSIKGQTKGCIEVEHRFFVDLIAYAKSQQHVAGKKFLVLKVDYSAQRKLGDKATTYGGTEVPGAWYPQHIPGNP